MSEAILRASGLRTGLFKSPHLVRPNERIRLNGLEISGSELDRLLLLMRDTIAGARERRAASGFARPAARERQCAPE